MNLPHYLVVRQANGPTSKKTLLSVESRNMNDFQAASNWCDFVEGEWKAANKGKWVPYGYKFSVVQVIDHDGSMPTDYTRWDEAKANMEVEVLQEQIKRMKLDARIALDCTMSGNALGAKNWIEHIINA